MSHPDPDVIAAIQKRTVPFTDDPTYARTFYDAMGRMVLLSGRLEKALDDLVIAGIVIAKDSGEATDIYVSLKRKLKLLIGIFHKSTELRQFHGRVVALAEDIRTNSNDRNFIIHASWTGFEDGQPNKLTMQHLKYADGHVITNDFTVTVENLSHMCSNFHLCYAKILALQIDIREILKEAQARAGAPTLPPLPS